MSTQTPFPTGTSLVYLLAASAGLMLGLEPVAWAVPTRGHRVLISGPSPYAVEVGKDVAERGGNAVDVAVAAALSLAVTHPYFGSLGGGGFAVLSTKAGKIEALDFRETAPKSANPALYNDQLKDASILGPVAVGVPGLPAGLWELQHKRGKLHWSQLFPRVIDLASKGFQVSGEWVDVTDKEIERFSPAGTRLFRRNGHPFRPGDVLKQPALAKLLKEMSVRGTAPFYQGLAARDIVDTLNAVASRSPGAPEGRVTITLEDMRGYKPRWLEPLKAEYRGYELWSFPPPSSGGIVSQSALGLLDLFAGGKEAKPLSVDEFHRIAEALKLAFRGRSKLGDPAFVKNPTLALLSPSFLIEEAKLFRADKSIDVAPLKILPPFEHEETTHLSVMTADGEGVAMTVTLNGSYGSGVVSEKYGIALNNEMDDFESRPGQANMYGLIQGKANEVEAGKRPLSSMTPTLVTKDGRLSWVVGAPGGPRIISAVTQTLYRALALGLNADRAVQAPRVHHQFLPDVLYVDPERFSPETLDGLRAKGHVVQTGSVGKAYAIHLGPDGILEGAFDARGEGAVGGY